MLALPDPRRPDRANPPTNFWWSLFFGSTGMIYIYWVPTGQSVNKEYYVEVLREFRKRFHRKRPALLFLYKSPLSIWIYIYIYIYIYTHMCICVYMCVYFAGQNAENRITYIINPLTDIFKPDKETFPFSTDNTLTA